MASIQQQINKNRLIPSGGNAEQVLGKQTNNNYELSWKDNPEPLTYVAGNGISISGPNISINSTILQQIADGQNIDYTAGNNIIISDGTISAELTWEEL